MERMSKEVFRSPESLAESFEERLKVLSKIEDPKAQAAFLFDLAKDAIDQGALDVAREAANKMEDGVLRKKIEKDLEGK